jgi:hypothetical protein
MTRILHFTAGPQDWQSLLADPKKQWRTGFSARTLAHCWEAAGGLPPEVQAVFDSSKEPLLADFVPILALPEFKVSLPGGGRASQNDLFLLGRSRAGPVSVMVEGKVSESFGPTISDWLVNASAQKEERLSFLLKTVGLRLKPSGTSRYQLFHRGASAVLEGERYRSAAAVMLVHSFSPDRACWSDYESFLALFGVRAEINTIQRVPGSQAVPLFSAWILGDCKFLKS